MPRHCIAPIIFWFALNIVRNLEQFFSVIFFYIKPSIEIKIIRNFYPKLLIAFFLCWGFICETMEDEDRGTIIYQIPLNYITKC